MFLLTKPANKHKQMLTCSSFLLFPAIYLFKCCLVASRAHWTETEPSSFQLNAFSILTLRVFTSTHPPPNFPHRRRTLGLYKLTQKNPPPKSLLMSVQTAVKLLWLSLKIYNMPHVSHPGILFFLCTISNTSSVMAVICWSCFAYLLWRVGLAVHLQDASTSHLWSDLKP